LHHNADFPNNNVLDAGLTRDLPHSATLEVHADKSAHVDEGCLSMTMRRDIRAIGGTAGRLAPHAALILAGLLLLIRP
jgi:hypothetical protein